MTAREEFYSDIITTAIEGGIGYWSVCLQYQWADERVHVVVGERTGDGTRATISPTDEDDIYEITPEVIREGIKVLRGGGVRINRYLIGTILVADTNADAGDIDADGADAIVQVALFGKLVYG